MTVTAKDLLAHADRIQRDVFDAFDLMADERIDCDPALAGSIDFLRGWFDADADARASTPLCEAQDLDNASSFLERHAVRRMRDYTAWHSASASDRHELERMMVELGHMLAEVQMWALFSADVSAFLSAHADHSPTTSLANL